MVDIGHSLPEGAVRSSDRKQKCSRISEIQPSLYLLGGTFVLILPLCSVLAGVPTPAGHLSPPTVPGSRVVPRDDTDPKKLSPERSHSPHRLSHLCLDPERLGIKGVDILARIRGPDGFSGTLRRIHGKHHGQGRLPCKGPRRTRTVHRDGSFTGSLLTDRRDSGSDQADRPGGASCGRGGNRTSPARTSGVQRVVPGPECKRCNYNRKRDQRYLN